jgi:hypothetical protein
MKHKVSCQIGQKARSELFRLFETKSWSARVYYRDKQHRPWRHVAPFQRTSYEERAVKL